MQFAPNTGAQLSGFIVTAEATKPRIEEITLQTPGGELVERFALHVGEPATLASAIVARATKEATARGLEAGHAFDVVARERHGGTHRFLLVGAP